ncbi:uncharacterized protein LOC125073148 [Vanessa atalanta]|uniref:uncharacterized protein LOC125073148 n=1 Tax=Vanessa atalanta TaxID=42275 RepID=UPI001FCD37A2|nr:uncharacterized protein LOC125073148 [Vanessa atalanta]
MALKISGLSVQDVVKVLESSDMNEFVDFVKEKQINGEKLLDVSEGVVKVWRPNINANKFILFVKDFKNNPQKFLTCLNNDDIVTIKETNLCSENQYQTVSVRKISQQETINFNTVEEILKKITAPKSFLYRNHTKKQERSSYVPMDGGSGKKPNKFFRLSLYEYPIFDLKSRFSKTDNCTDRGYYSVKTDKTFHIQKTCKKSESRPKYKSLTTAEELNDKITEDHFYEDLCYNDVTETKRDSIKDLNKFPTNQAKPCIVKIQELFQSFKLPFFRKTEVAVERDENIKQNDIQIEREGNVYENSSNDMYDSIHVARENYPQTDEPGPELAADDYLEPVQVSRDYCDVCLKQRDDSLLGFIMNYFESRLGIKRETNDVTHSEESETEASCEREWERNNMAARPLPVPVENEPFYMSIDRTEAENLLMGQPDGTFILRPSSQPNHAYTLSVSCANSVHNVGVRRRPDGRLALGFARRGERSFTSVASLLRHHKKKRLLLVAGGEMIGATTLNETPQYYQIPSNLPVMRCS